MVVKSLDLVNLDFAGAKTDLIAFMKLSPLFKDYDFTGSNLNLMADILAYNFTKHAFLTNMLMSEAHIDSAQLTSSVFSHGKDLNYLPRSARSAHLPVTVTFTANGASQPYVIPKGSSFATLIKNNSYVFAIPESIVVSSPNTEFSFTTEIYEGIYVKDSYVYATNDANPYPRFRITNKNIDTTSLTVSVYEDNSTVATSFQFASSLLGLSQLDKIFFLQASETGYYEIQFGDGVIGYTPKQNSLIVLDYRITNADAANGARSFIPNFIQDEWSNMTVTALDTDSNQTTAIGGAAAESIDSVRYYAPRHFQTQERCVVPTDYEVLMKIAYPEINAITAYGGEELEPPQFGYVVVSVDLPGLDTLPISKEAEYNSFLLKRCPMSIKPIFVDPERTYIQVNSIVRYNINITTNTPNRIESLVATTISNYNIDNLNDFNTSLRFSPLCTLIDQSDPSIISNRTNLKLYKKLIPINGKTIDYVIDFHIPLTDGLSSTAFIYQGQYVFLEDDGLGNIFIIQYINNQATRIVMIGNIDYTMGVVKLNRLLFDNYIGDHFKIYGTPADFDISAVKHTILIIESDEVHIEVLKIAE